MSTPSKKYLVVDASILGAASGNPSGEKAWKAAELLSRIIRVCHRVVLDPPNPNEETILDEYERQSGSEVVRRWIIAIQAKDDKIVRRSRAQISLKALSDPDDQKYFQVAVNSPHKLIISEDSDLTSIANHQEVIARGIEIWDLAQALSNL